MARYAIALRAFTSLPIEKLDRLAIQHEIDAIGRSATAARRPEMGLFERFLTVWVALGILAGVALGLAAPAGFQAIAALEFAHVNLVVAVFIWVMIYPMMIQIDWTRGEGRRQADRVGWC